MASPFTIFRRHQKALLAVLGVMVMLAFVFLPIILENMGATPDNDPILVRTNAFGNLTVRDVERLRYRRQQLHSLLEAVIRAVRLAGENPVQAEFLAQMVASDSREQAVNDWLLARHAEKLGIVVDNQAINAYIKELVRDRVSARELKAMLAELKMNDRQLFDSLREQMLAMQVQEMFRPSLYAIPPAERWDYFQRLRRKASIELAAVAIEPFAEKVPDPGDEALKALFEKYGDRLPDPSSPEPGFRQPHRIALEYFKGDVGELAKAITDQEVQEEYAKNRDEYDKMQAEWERTSRGSSTSGGSGATPASTGAPASQEGPASSTSTGQPDAQQPDSPPSPPGPNSSDQPPSGAPATPPTTPAGEASSETPGDNPPTGSTGGTPMPEPDSDSGENGDSGDSGKPGDSRGSGGTSSGSPSGSSPVDPSSRVSRGPWHLVSMQAESPATPASETPAGTAVAAEAPASDTPAGGAGGEPPAEAPGPAMPGAESPAGAEAPTAPESPGVPEGPAVPEPPQRETSPATGTAPAAAESAPAGGPSKEMQEFLRRKLAREKLGAALARIEGELSKYGRAWQRYQLDKGRNPALAAPARPDIEALALENGLSATRTRLLSVWELRELDIGRTLRDWRTSFLQFALEKMPEFQPCRSFDAPDPRIWSIQYVAWKVEEEKERAVKFDDPGVRDRVLAAWRLIEARKLALDEARKLADAARAKGVGLREALADRPNLKVTDAGPFTWLTTGYVPRLNEPVPLYVSEVPGVDQPGDEFMRAVFSLEAGAVGVAMNQPQSAVYVVRVIEFTPPENQLWAVFESERFEQYAAVAQKYQMRMWRDWIESLKKSYGLTWEQPPERLAREEQPADEE